MNTFEEIFSESKLDVVYRLDDPELWDLTFERLFFRNVDYLQSTLDYQLAYQKSRGSVWHDFSCILRSNGEPIGLWAISLRLTNGIGEITSQGRPLMAPQFTDHCPTTTRKKYTKECFRVANCLASSIAIKEWQSTSGFQGTCAFDDWHLLSMEQGARCFVHHELYVDLGMPIAKIKSHFRKSYRSLVNHGEKKWKIEILRSPGDTAIWDEFRMLHKTVAGRITRSSVSWHVQHEAIASDQGFLVTLRDLHNRMIGAGYFMCSPDEGIYAVGAYDRSLFGTPVGHVVQYNAINELQRRGCKWHHIGTRVYPSDKPTPDGKELNISYFKEGFATHVLPKYTLTNSTKNSNTDNNQDFQIEN